MVEGRWTRRRRDPSDERRLVAGGEGRSALVATAARAEPRYVTVQCSERVPLTVLDVAAEAATAPQFPAARLWWVKAAHGGLELRTISGLPEAAPAARSTRVAAGTALLAARLTVAVAGARPFTTLHPDPRRPAVLAVLRLGAAAAPTRAERVLHRTLVRPEPISSGRPVGPALPVLRHAADVEGGAWLRAVTDRADRSRLMAAVGREHASDRESALLVLGSHVCPAGEIRAGQALRRTLLTAQALGLRGEVLAGPIELSGARARDIPGAGVGLLPQVLLAVGPLGAPEA